MDDDWVNCDTPRPPWRRYCFSRAHAVQLLRDEGIAPTRRSGAGKWEGEVDDDVIIPMPGQDLVSVGAMVVGTGEEDFQDGAAAERCSTVCRDDATPARWARAVVADGYNHRIRMLSADVQQVSTVAGDSGEGHRDGAAAQAQFSSLAGLTVLPDGRVLVADCDDHRSRVLSADLQQVNTVAGNGGSLRRRRSSTAPLASHCYMYPMGACWWRTASAC
jgi:hypothetical protein